MTRSDAAGRSVHRHFAGYNEELQAAGKKDDDGLVRPGLAASNWKSNTVKIRSRRRRVLVVGGAILVLWLVLRSLPYDFWAPLQSDTGESTEFHQGNALASGGRWQGSRGTGFGSRPARGGWQSKDIDESKPPPRPKTKKPNENTHYYDGDILFRNLPSSLHAIQRTSGFRKANQNVLFAASDLKSLSNLVPLACAMSKTGATYVHVALFARSELKLQEIMRINGVDEKECKVYWHDARPNWAKYSTDFRVEASVASALEHIQDFMHPQVIIMDDSSLEDRWFTRQVRAKAEKHEWPVIELPAGASEKLHWLSRLDSEALRVFHKTRVDILVQAPQQEAGGLLRLLKSIKQADYHGLPVPKLTIELPAVVDGMVSWYVSDFKWPPHSTSFLGSQLNVRHRIPGQSLSPEEASIRFMESFYPMDGEHSHVLVLNSNVELSPLYYHWTLYQILQYKYAHMRSTVSNQLLGISLGLPTTYLNGSTAFVPPNTDTLESSADWPGRSDPRDADMQPPFLWQAPNPSAAVFFGDKWAELHDYVKNRIQSSKRSKRKEAKVIGEALPAWSEHVLELMRARGWSMLYPASSRDSSAMATVRHDVWKPPEEFAEQYALSLKQESKDESGGDQHLLGDGKESLRGIEAHWKQAEVLATSYQPLDALLPFNGPEPHLTALPHLLFDGTIVQTPNVPALATQYAQEFRKTYGGCGAGALERMPNPIPGRADDLFC
jgi:hypothetical protein